MAKTLKIISYNVNGLRAAIKKGFMEWLEAANPDILCLQEIKMEPSQIDMKHFEALGYSDFWFPAQKKGYSGVAIFTKIKPDHVEYGSGDSQSDGEGRIIRIDFGKISLLNVYIPSGTTGDVRQSYKMQWLGEFEKFIKKLLKKHPNLIICGDVNICHQAIDIHNPISNAKSSGFLPEERAWVTKFLGDGFIDTFRHFNKEPHHYSWWTYRMNARARNLGWRIDYFFASKSLEKNLKSAFILPEAKHSDHAPVGIEVKID